MRHPETWQAIRALLQFRNGAPPLTAATPRAALPLSFPQQRLWFLQQVQPQSTAFHLPHLVHLHGALDVAALTKSLNALRQRHTILRTVFKLDVSQQPVQEVLPFTPLTLAPTTVAHLPAPAQAAAVAAWITTNAQQPFDLVQEGGLRAWLLTRQADEHLLLLLFHHIVYDFWSQSVLLRELQTLYTGFCQGQEPRLPALPLQYGDFAAWQRAWLGEATTQAPLLAYWQKQLAALPAPPLPIATQAATQSAAGTQKFTLSPALTAALKALAQQEEETLYTILCAAFKVLLHCYTGQTDIFLGGLLANRHRPELEPLIGNFVNILILRTDLAGNPSFRELIGRVRQTMAGAIQHQDLPIQLLNTPVRLAQIVFAFRNTPQHQLTLPGLTAELTVLPSAQADFDLFVDLIEELTPTGVIITGPVTYNQARFAPAAIAQLLVDFAQVLAILVADPDQRLADLPAVKLAGFEKPSAVGAMPVSPLAQSTSGRIGATQPQTALEAQIAAIWQQVLGLAQVDIHATFFELGASSLVLLQVHQQLQATLAPDLAPVQLFQYPTIHALADYLSGQPATSENGVTAAVTPDYVQAGQARAERKRAARQQMPRPRKEQPA